MIEYSCADCGMPAAATCPTCGVTRCLLHFGALLLCEACVDMVAVDVEDPAWGVVHDGTVVLEDGALAVCSCCWATDVAGVFDD